MTRKQFTKLSGATLALVLVLTACKSGDNSNSTVSANAGRPSKSGSLTKPQYLRQANGICGVEQAKPNKPAPTSASEFVEQLGQQIADLEALQVKLRALRPPPADRDALEANFLSPNDRQIAALKTGLEAAEGVVQKSGTVKDAEDSAKPSLQRFAAIARSQNEFARTYGLTDCIE